MLPKMIVAPAITISTGVVSHWYGVKAPSRPHSPISTAKPAAFDATARKAVTGVGAPWYTSGTQIWNGNAPILNATPERTSTMPSEATKLSGFAARNRASSP
jgi:hypothetical protein